MEMIIQGRKTTEKDIQLVQRLLQAKPDWSRTRLSQELCLRWDWRNQKGDLKDMACRSFLRKLEERGFITLPAPRILPRSPQHQVDVPHQTDPITGSLRNIMPITVMTANRGELPLYRCLVDRYHYLGYHSVGQNMKYLVFDKDKTPLSCLLFGSAAWKSAPRDEYIGWSQEVREARVNWLTNNTRFLILPWVTVPHLASHILGQVARRISQDWKDKYGHPVYLLETFVEQGRFLGTCYRAANWRCVGKTRGRSRNDRYTRLQVPVKDIYLYPLVKNFREVLCDE